MADSPKILKDLTLMLLYLSSWEEKELPQSCRRSWKGYDFEILNELTEEGLIYGSHRSKSVYLDEAGIERARILLAEYGIDVNHYP